ncbi:RNA 3'-terminal phosphate cyclase [Liparis tanakae]|uniref:RNA 3'-terminal phosphate cyclase n=1 Tax=Liparis tanakae TaxID=230148 RepID=A0A4Z2F6Y0_9TELE|nr:RNA 3'-terminal phosphate cyclase [Liparis tanakae]
METESSAVEIDGSVMEGVSIPWRADPAGLRGAQLHYRLLHQHQQSPRRQEHTRAQFELNEFDLHGVVESERDVGPVARPPGPPAHSSRCGLPERQSRVKKVKKPQHLSGLQLVSDLCSGSLQGAAIGSTDISLTPGKIQSGNHTADTETAGSVCLLLQVALPCALFSDSSSQLVLKGGTNAEMAPQIDYTVKVVTRDLPGPFRVSGHKLSPDGVPGGADRLLDPQHHLHAALAQDRRARLEEPPGPPSERPTKKRPTKKRPTKKKQPAEARPRVRRRGGPGGGPGPPDGPDNAGL